MTPKILLFDIETSPNLGYYFELYKEGNIIWNEKNWYILSFAYKWLGKSRVKAYSLPDFKLYKKHPANDKELCRELWKLFDEADILIAHNGNSFDIKKAQARFVEHGFIPPEPFKSIDTKLVAKRYFKFDSNKLDDLGKYLHIGQKIHVGGWQIWLGCMQGDKKAWKKMVKYNKRDVELLEKIYLALRPWMTQHPNLNLLNNEINSCTNCGSKHIIKKGYGYSRVSKFQRHKCYDCGHWMNGRGIRLEGNVLR